MLYLFIAAILWEVPHLSFRLRTETRRAQNRNLKENGNRILEVSTMQQPVVIKKPSLALFVTQVIFFLQLFLPGRELQDRGCEFLRCSERGRQHDVLYCHANSLEGWQVTQTCLTLSGRVSRQFILTSGPLSAWSSCGPLSVTQSYVALRDRVIIATCC